jgi:hypothetical protein
MGQKKTQNIRICYVKCALLREERSSRERESTLSLTHTHITTQIQHFHTYTHTHTHTLSFRMDDHANPHSVVYPIPKSLQESAHIRGLESYKSLYEYSIKNPEEFWKKVCLFLIFLVLLCSTLHFLTSF